MKEKLENISSKVNWDRTLSYGSIALTAATVIYLLYYFVTACFDLSKPKMYNLYFAGILILILAMTAYLLYFLLSKKEFKYDRVYLILALGWGIAMQLIMPPISGADEATHYFGAYHASNIMMGIKDVDMYFDDEYGFWEWELGVSHFLMREEDLGNITSIDVTFPDQYEILADGNWFHCSEEGKTLTQCYEYPVVWYRYPFAGLGITIARLLNWGFVGTVFAGRMMNTLFIAFVGWFVLKLINVGKLQLILFSMFPFVLQLCNSFSYDIMSVGFTILLLGLCLYYSKPGVKVHSWDIIFILATTAILMPNKIVYAIFIIWILCIPFKKWWELLTCKKWYEYVVLGIMAAGASYVFYKLIFKYYWVIHNIVFDDSSAIAQDTSRTAMSWWDFKENPLEYLAFIWNGIKIDFWYNIKHIVGAELGHIKLAVPVAGWITIGLLILFMASFFICRGKSLGKQQVISIVVGAIACLVIIFLGCMIRFTPAEGSERIQVSYRYLIPVYMALAIGCGSDKKENKGALALIYIQHLILIIVSCNALEFLFHLRDGM